MESLGLSKVVNDLIVKAGFKKLTEPQIKAIPAILSGKNVLIIAPTGSGKTEAAIIPVLDMILRNEPPPISLLYVTPLRALNRDLIDRISWWADRLDLRIAVRHGDTAVRERRRQSVQPPDILITTPETLALLLNTRVMSRHLANVRWVIVDEVHELVDSKRGAQLSIALEKLRKLAGEFQVIGLSATVGSPDKVSKFLVGNNRSIEVITVDISKMMKFKVLYPQPTKDDHELADRLYTFPSVAARLRVIREILDNHRTALIFTNTRPMAEILSNRLILMDDDYPINIHHGSLSAEKRVRIERMLKGGKLKGVICTSSLELGIDIGEIDLVIQYNSPRQVTRLIQRVGRSGHWIERESKGVIIVQDSDDALESIVIVYFALKGKMEEPKIPLKALDVLSHEIAGYLINNKEVDIWDIYNVIKQSYIYADITPEEFTNLLKFLSSLSDRYLFFDESNQVIRRPLNRARLFNYYFENLSMIPEIKQYLVVNEEDGSPIGILDGEFVSEYGEPGFKFIIAGRPWRIIQVYKDRVYVKPEEDPIGAIPFWIGEEIPVPDFIAFEVGRLKRKLEEMYKSGLNEDIIFRKLADEYKSDINILKTALKSYLEQIKRGLPIPTDKRIIIEKVDEKIVIHVHGGTLINRALASFFIQAIFKEFGETIYISSDPYRIIVSSYSLGPEDVKRLMYIFNEEECKKLIIRGIEETPFFRWRLIQVAKRMGIISKDVELDPAKTEQLVISLRDTPAYEEALRESIYRDRDVEGALSLINKVRRGEIEVVCIESGYSPTPITRETVLRKEIRLEPGRVDRLEVLQLLSIRNKLLNEVRTFACISCFNYVDEVKIKQLPDKIYCPLCGSDIVGMSSALYEDVSRILSIAKVNIKGVKRTRIFRELNKSAKLISKYGKVAAVVLASDIPIKYVHDILRKEKQISGRLFKLIAKAERDALLEKYQ